MSDIAIKPFPENHKKEYTVEVPGSKSITNRALLLAALEAEIILRQIIGAAVGAPPHAVILLGRSLGHSLRSSLINSLGRGIRRILAVGAHILAVTLTQDEEENGIEENQPHSKAGGFAEGLGQLQAGQHLHHDQTDGAAAAEER